MIDAIFQILGAGLSIWDHKDKTKYVDRLMDLKRSYNEEINKPGDQRSDAVLDHIGFELRVLGLAFAAGVGQPNASVQPGKPVA